MPAHTHTHTTRKWYETNSATQFPFLDTQTNTERASKRERIDRRTRQKTNQYSLSHSFPLCVLECSRAKTADFLSLTDCVLLLDYSTHNKHLCIQSDPHFAFEIYVDVESLKSFKQFISVHTQQCGFLCVKSVKSVATHTHIHTVVQAGSIYRKKRSGVCGGERTKKREESLLCG